MSERAKGKSSGIYFKVTDEERSLIEQRMALMGVHNMSAYIRKMCIDGYIVQLQIKELDECAKLLRYTSNNVNQDVLCKGWINHLIHCDCGSFVVICSVIARKGEKHQQLSQKCYQEGNMGEPLCLQLQKLKA